MKTLEERVQTAKQLHAAREAEVKEIERVILEELTDDLLRTLDGYRRYLIMYGVGSSEENAAWSTLSKMRYEHHSARQRRLMSMLPELYLS